MQIIDFDSIIFSNYGGYGANIYLYNDITIC